VQHKFTRVAKRKTTLINQ